MFHSVTAGCKEFFFFHWPLRSSYDCCHTSSKYAGWLVISSVKVFAHISVFVTPMDGYMYHILVHISDISEFGSSSQSLFLSEYLQLIVDVPILLLHHCAQSHLKFLICLCALGRLSLLNFGHGFFHLQSDHLDYHNIHAKSAYYP